MIMAKAKTEKNKKETPAKSVNVKETPVPEVVQKEPDNKPAASKSNHGAWIMALIFGAIVIIALSYSYNNVLEKNILKKGCSELSNSPELKYPTVCVPLDADSNRGDYVDQKSDPMCRCKVDMGNGTSTVIDIRLAN